MVHVFSPSGVSSVFHQVTNSHVAAQAARQPRRPRSGPSSIIGVGNLGVQAAARGDPVLLGLLIVINIAFGLLNMLPLMPFDGGHVAVAVYEWIRTKKGQPYYRADITKLFPFLAPFLAFLVLFAVSLVFLDITHPIQNLPLIANHGTLLLPPLAPPAHPAHHAGGRAHRRRRPRHACSP